MSSVRIHPWGIRHPWSLPPLSDLEKLIQKYRTLLGSSWIKDWGQVTAISSARPKSYVFTNRPNPVALEVLGQWGIEMIVSEEDDPKKALTDFLKELVS